MYESHDKKIIAIVSLEEPTASFQKPTEQYQFWDAAPGCKQLQDIHMDGWMTCFAIATHEIERIVFYKKRLTWSTAQQQHHHNCVLKIPSRPHAQIH